MSFLTRKNSALLALLWVFAIGHCIADCAHTHPEDTVIPTHHHHHDGADHHHHDSSEQVDHCEVKDSKPSASINLSPVLLSFNDLPARFIQASTVTVEFENSTLQELRENNRPKVSRLRTITESLAAPNAPPQI